MTLVPVPGESLADLAETANREHALAATSVESFVVHAIRAGEALAAAKWKLGHGEWLPWLAENFDANRSTATRYMQVAANGARVHHLDTMRLALNAVSKGAEADERAELGEAPTPEPAVSAEGTYPTIVIDPPWRYENRATRGAAEDHYPTMSMDELVALELPAADDAHLYLWVTNSFLREGFVLLDAWGFTYKTCLTWVKPQMGMGNYFRSMTEHVLFGMRGKQPTLRNNQGTWFQADRTAHSAKPESFYDMVESCSPGPWLEMFARRRRFSWDVWGKEA